MSITLLYFAAVRDLAGCSEEVVEPPPEVRTVGDLRAWLGGERPSLRDALHHVRWARNEAFAKEEEPLADGDVVAIIPPLSGG